MAKHDDKVYLLHILEALTRLEQLVTRGRDVYEEDFAIADSFVRELSVVGEAANNLSTDFRSKNKQILWGEVIGMRNWLVHGYAEIDWIKVWETAVEDVPKLREQIEIILMSL